MGSPDATNEKAAARDHAPEYVATGDDDLDQLLVAEIRGLGPGALKGHELKRIGPSKYKLGGKRVFMKLASGTVRVRAGADFIPLNDWLDELEPAEEEDDDGTMFAALDTASPYAHRE